ncbi:hypothetical protein Poli38472_002081 [Pythium oligandrum]|uniref:Glutamine-dependent NAD(+) synthetase n=1 Tax=Pythium oligandrum TaxID=41045 RepID=A0A8K1CI43_PYTOL|nr:hypothetical protein Poli38472_002081 [Pythium oligandrum]|eukprot:TMW63140.1 hypothetical protein Poli38472_002081 [Pythium oligandrum]
MSALVTVATCNLNQWALDFDGNLERIITSIREAKRRGATYRVGPELEVCGYGCEDHFFEPDTFFHCWESIASILASDETDGILCDIGMPVMHNGVRYNCRLYCLNKKILFIRPKLFLADDGNYRETRWFTAWKVNKENKDQMLQQHVLPRNIQKITGQVHVPFGYGALSTLDTTCSSETCEELFTPDSPHINLSLAGVEIISNGSGSHHQLRKLHQRLELIRGATTKGGGIYLYANQQGCDGGRLYYDGCALIAVNGEVVAQGTQFSVKDVEVVTATVDLDDVRSYRGSISSRSEQASALKTVLPTIHVDFSLCHDEEDLSAAPTRPIDLHYHVPEEEIALGPACWLWDYLRRSGGGGYFLPLSGGADSSSVACIVGVMCHLVTEAANGGDPQVIRDVQRIMGTTGEEYKPLTPQDLASHVLHTTYMGTKNSSAATKKRASTLAQELGCYHLNMGMDTMVDAVINTFALLTGKTPRFMSLGGTIQEDLALQNIQARLRMVMAYLLAQLLPWVRSKNGFLLVLSSANVDEALRGYMTKYDCSSGDLNPIGAVSKGDLKKLLRWAAVKYNYPTLQTVVDAPPTAELRPTGNASDDDTTDHSQLDEEDMGMSYEELGYFGRLRKIDRSGPFWMYRKLTHIWSHLTPTVVAEKVKRFFFYYSINRHKMTTLTPSYHAENYSPDDNRFDHRPFLYNARWTRQFRAIDSLATKLEEKKEV